MFPDFQLVPWLYFLPLLAWIVLFVGLFVKKAFLPLAIASLVIATAFVICGVIFGMGFPVLCVFCAMEGIMLCYPLLRKEGESA